ncbi:MAG: hypothetical protein Tsb0016_00720 [Sphingomonadales bacterium]
MVNRHDAPPPSPPKAVHLHASQQAMIAQAARAAWPAEACGLLIGTRNADGAVIVHHLMVTANVLAGHAHDRFEIATEVLLNAHRTARAAGQAVVGHFHSHPSGDASWSATDAAWAHEPGVIWLIQALGAQAMGPLRAYLAQGVGDRGGVPFSPLAIVTLPQ